MQAIKTLSIVVPVYNSASSLPILLDRLSTVLEAAVDAYEIILVNDGSADDSWRVIEGLIDQYDYVCAINLMRNFGQHNALLCGIRAAQYAAIVTMDDDLQNPPEAIIDLLAELNQGYDVVYGAPETDVHGSWTRYLSSWVVRRILQPSVGKTVADGLSSFRIFRTELREGFAKFDSAFISIDVLLTWATRSFAVLPVAHAPREFGTSTYSLLKLIRHFAVVITGFTTWPLRLASILGFAFTVFGMLIFVYVVGNFLIFGSIPGFTFLAAIVAIFSGVQVFALGILGEYILRIYQRTMNEPAYLERERLLSNTAETEAQASAEQTA